MPGNEILRFAQDDKGVISTAAALLTPLLELLKEYAGVNGPASDRCKSLAQRAGRTTNVGQASPLYLLYGNYVHSTMRNLQGVGSILISNGRAKLLIATSAWPGARFGSLCQSESSTTPSERLSRLITLASPILLSSKLNWRILINTTR